MISLDAEMGSIGFENGDSFTADLIVAADGIRVRPKPDTYLSQC